MLRFRLSATRLSRLISTRTVWAIRNHDIAAISSHFLISTPYFNRPSRGLTSSSPWPTMLTITVEGNIGSGKTTLLNHFSHLPGTMVMKEPINKWTNFHGYNLLDLMYKDPRRWSVAFQMYVLLTLAENHRQMHTSPVKLMERSMYSARYCFIENLYSNGYIHHLEYEMLSEMFNHLSKEVFAHVDLIVYVYTEPETAYKRIQARSRKEEEIIPFDYVEKLHFFHEQWLRGHAFSLPAPVLILDGNKPMEEMLEEYNKCEKTITGNKVIRSV